MSNAAIRPEQGEKNDEISIDALDQVTGGVMRQRLPDPELPGFETPPTLPLE
jgi:hypothetical protein